MAHVTIAKLGGSALGVDGTLIPKVINRIRHIIDQNTKVVAVFSAPITDYEKKVSSMTDVDIFDQAAI